MTFANVKRTPKRDAIDVQLAIKLYDRCSDWGRVAATMKRPDGTRFTAAAIRLAVWRFDHSDICQACGVERNEDNSWEHCPRRDPPYGHKWEQARDPKE